MLQVLRDVLGIPNIYVGQALQDTAVPGATSSESAIWDGTKLFMGILRGSDAVVQKSGNVKAMPIAAVNLQYNDMVANLFWYLHFYFLLMREEIHIARMDDHFQHIHSNLIF